MPSGSGAIQVHRMLAQRLQNYTVVPFHPGLTYCPPLIPLLTDIPAGDLIHTTPDYARFYAKPHARLVVTFHNFVLDKEMRPHSSLLQRIHYSTDLSWWTKWAVRHADRITAVSEYTADLVRRELNCQREIVVIPNGIDTGHFCPAGTRPAGGNLRLLFAGNPTRRKGAHWLPALARAVSGCATILCTSGSRDESAAELQRAGIRMLGSIRYDDMPDLYRSVDALLLPTVREGDSLAVLEAMSSGLPVVASDCSSLPERVVPGKGGFLCRVGDIDEFAEAIRQLQDPVLRRAMGEFNRAMAIANFSSQKMAARYREVFDEAM